ncbi:hypothetical protein [Nocardia concava]|uniref:hypothetical protein n=1 Tax=Nocardia concava TaxID=257281 RepID=UPI0002DEA567|nr:hypothetical protein [Nocardia concava]
MSEHHPPIEAAHYLRLRTLAKFGRVGLEPRLNEEDAVALESLLNAWLITDPVAARQCYVTIQGPWVRMLATGVRIGGVVVGIPMDFLADEAGHLSDMLGEAAEFARMTNGQGGSTP